MVDYIKTISVGHKLDAEDERRLNKCVSEIRDLCKGTTVLVVDSKLLRETGRYSLKEIK